MAQVASSATTVPLAAANKNRVMAVVHNDSTAVLYIKLGADASSTDYTYRMKPQGTMELPIHEDGRVYDGLITGVWASANGFAYVTEYGRNAA